MLFGQASKQAKKPTNRLRFYECVSFFATDCTRSMQTADSQSRARARTLHFIDGFATWHDWSGANDDECFRTRCKRERLPLRLGTGGWAWKRMERSVVFTTPAVRRLYENRRTKYFADVIEKSCNRRALAGRAGSDRAAPPSGSSVTGWSTGRLAVVNPRPITS